MQAFSPSATIVFSIVTVPKPTEFDDRAYVPGVDSRGRVDVDQGQLTAVPRSRQQSSVPQQIALLPLIVTFVSDVRPDVSRGPCWEVAELPLIVLSRIVVVTAVPIPPPR